MTGRIATHYQLEVLTAGSPEPGKPAVAPTLVFVHGGAHTAACWSPFQQWFAGQGIASIAPSLRGHGASQGRKALWRASLRDFEADVAQAIDEYVGRGPFLLIGHSMGGNIVQRYLFTLAREANLPCPSGVVLLCTATARVWGTMGRQAPGMRGIGRKFLRGLLHGEPSPMTATSEAVRRYFFTPQTDEQVVLAGFRQMRAQKTESLRATMWEQSRFPVADGSRSARCAIPMRVFGAEQDAFVTGPMIEATAAAYGAQWRIFPGAGHDAMLDSGWQDVARAIAEFAASLATEVPAAPGASA